MNTTHLEACFGARVLIHAIRRARRPVSAGTVLEALSNLGAYDLGGFTVSFAPGAQHGSESIELGMVTRDGRRSAR